MPPKGKKRGGSRAKAKSEEQSDIEEELPPPPPPRPFKEIEGLPLSIEEPSYSILNNALSLKDSAVLYSSLMRSRKSYTSGNVFDLYWAKGRTKFDNDVNARDRMNKFCECSMNMGPHNYDVRFFILKNDEVEKKRQDEKDKKKEKRLASKKLREEKQKLRELKKAKQDASAQGLLPNADSSSATPVLGSESQPNTSMVSNGDDTAADKTNKDDSDKEDDDMNEDSDNDDNEENESQAGQSREASAQPEGSEQIKVEEGPGKVGDATNKTHPHDKATKTDDKAEFVEEKKVEEAVDIPQNRPLPPLQVQNHSPSNSAVDIPRQQPGPPPSQSQREAQQAPTQPQLQAQQIQPQNAQVSQPPAPIPQNNAQSSTQQPSQEAPQQLQQQQPIQQPVQQAPPPPPPQSAQSQNDIMQTPESQMMIANLNAIARREPSLNALMKVVATGNARPEQIREFQGYIQRAKAMGPTPYYQQAFPNPPMMQQPSPPPPKPPKKVKPPKQPKPPKEKQLTTFQEMYVDGADLVFEFNENPNIRYHAPKDSIIEKLANGDLLVSTLVIHNRDQLKKWEAKQKVRREKKEAEEKEKAAKEEELRKKELENAKTEGEKKPEVPEKRQRRTRKAAEKEAEEKEAEDEEAQRKAAEEEKIHKEKEDEEKRKAKEEAEANKEPITYFSALTFSITNISERYYPIFINSFNKQDEVKTKMEEILKKGVRVPKHYLWYSVDAYEDETLAENLRETLFLIENPPKGKNRKRVLEEHPLLGAASTTKRVKKET